MPIGKYNSDGTVDIYNSKTGETKEGVQPGELSSISPNLMAEYMEAQDPTAKLTRVKAEKELGELASGVSEEKPRTGADAKVIASSKSGLDSIERAREGLKGFMGNVRLFGASTDLFPGDKVDLTPWGRGIESDLFNAADVILRMRTGAAAPEEEVRRYVKQKGPRLTDSTAVKKQKLDAIQSELEDTLKEMGEPLSGGGLDKDDEDLINKYKK